MTTGKDLINSVSALQGSKGEIGAMKNKAVVSGAVIGMLGGFYYGYAKKHNMLVTGIMGALAGAIIAGVLMPSS